MNNCISNTIEFFLILGLNSNNEDMSYYDYSGNNFKVEILNSFPEISSNIPKYLENINMWCFPDGYTIYDSYKNVINNDEIPKIRQLYPSFQKHSIRDEMSNYKKIQNFIMTDKDYIKRYGTCLNFFEKIDLKDCYPGSGNDKLLIDKNILFVPKSICLISKVPFFSTQTKILNFLFEKLIKNRHFEYLPKKNMKDNLLQLPIRFIDEYENLIEKNSKQTGEFKWNEKFEDIQMRDIKTEENIIINEFNLWEFYISFIFHALPLNISNSNEYNMYNCFDMRKNNIFSYVANKKGEFANNNIKILFKKLSTNNILKMLKFILLEKQIIVFSENTNDIIAIIELILDLMTPLKWGCIYVPFLPISLWQILQAVIPYIIGIKKSNKEFITKNIDFSDKIIIDLDENEITYQNDNIYFPKKPIDQLNKNIKNVIKALLSIDNNPSITRYENDKKTLELYLTLKNKFFGFFQNLINNFTPYFLFSKDFDHKNLCASDIFDQENYLKIYEEDEFIFMKEFCSKTMMFSKFLEDSYKILYLTDFKKVEICSDLDCDEDVNYFINYSKKFSKQIKKNNFKFEGKIDLDNFLHLRCILENDSDTFIKNQLSNIENPKNIYTLCYFVKYFVHFKSEKQIFEQNKYNFKFLVPEIDNTKIIDISSLYTTKEYFSISNLNDPIIKVDEFNEHTSVNMPKILKKEFSFENTNNLINFTENKKISNDNIIMNILDKENQLKEKKKKSRIDIFSGMDIKKIDLFSNLNDFNQIEQKLQIKKLESSNNLKNSDKFEQNQIKLIKTKSENNNIIPKTTINKIITEKQITSFQNLKKNKNNICNEEIKRVPILNINEKEKEIEGESTEFQIFSYLLSDLIDKNPTNNNLQFPANQGKLLKKDSTENFGPKLEKKPNNPNILENDDASPLKKKNTLIKKKSSIFESKENRENENKVITQNVRKTSFKRIFNQEGESTNINKTTLTLKNTQSEDVLFETTNLKKKKENTMLEESSYDYRNHILKKKLTLK